MSIPLAAPFSVASSPGAATASFKDEERPRISQIATDQIRECP